MDERTLVLIKPDAVQRELWLDIIDMYRVCGFKIVRTKLFSPMPRTMIESLYEAHSGRSYFFDNITFMNSGPIIALIIEGEDAISAIRKINGATDPANADKHSVRGKYGSDIRQNAVHSSDSSISAMREITLVFE